jgi:polyisoprenyl-phosphate glycosyltransferase
MQHDEGIIISVVIPAFNEGSSVADTCTIVTEELMKFTQSFEIIFVDDGSSDNTFSFLKEIAEKDARIKVIRLLNNSGSHIAIRLGLSYAKGDCACFIACDLQEPPSLICQMKVKLSGEYDIVWAVRNSREDSFFSVFFAKIFYWLARKIVSTNIPPSGASMFIVSSKVLEVLKKYNERNLTLEGLFATMGFKSTYIYYDRQERLIGKSKWTVSKKFKLFIDFFVAYSYFPIRFVSVMGILFSLFGFLWTIYILARQIFVGDLTSGWPALTSILLIGFGITNISLGIIAEYLWRTLDETRKRPNFIVDKTINITDEPGV